MIKRTAMAADTKPASLFIFDDRIAWASVGFVGAETIRPACALLIGAYRKLSLTIARRHVLNARAVLVAPNVARRLNAEEAGFYSLTLDPAHKGCRYLRDQVLKGRRVLDLSVQLGESEIEAVKEAIEQPQDCAASLHLSERLLRHFFPGIEDAAPIEPRVLTVARCLREQLPTRVNMRHQAEACHLSAGRLTHLFSEELGVSIRTYLRWVKLCKAGELFGRNQSIADVAAAIGFSDAAHLYRVFRTYFSVKPSLLADPARVHVEACGRGTTGNSR